MKKRIFAGLLALCMVFNVMPATAFAEESTTEPVVTEVVCEAKEDCKAETHIETCAKYPAPVVVCEGAEECAAETHIEGCAKYVAPVVVCEAKEECAAETHIETCAKYVIPCTNDEDCLAEEHVDGCPADVVYLQCPTEGCELVEGHPGECTGAITYETTGIDTEAELKSALEAGGTVVLTGDIEVTAQIDIPAGVDVTLDLAGNNITSGYQSESSSKHIYPLSNNGKLTIVDKVGNGSIEGRGIYNQDGATLVVDGAKIVAKDWNGGACVWNYGTGEVYLSNATMIGNTGVVYSEGYLEINGGTYTCYSGIKDDGTFDSPTYNIRAYNGLKITDGVFTSRHGVISVGGGEAVIEDGSYTIEFKAATTSNVVYIYGDADLTIEDGAFISDDSADKADSGAAVLVSGSDAKLTINDGTYVGMNGMIGGNSNTVINAGEFSTVWDYNHYGKLEEYISADTKIIDSTTGNGWAVVPKTYVTELEGEGTVEKPYLIKNVHELKWFRDQVNSGRTYSGKYIQLTDSVDLNNEEWTPIGTSSNNFQGIFDGNEKTISNLLITGTNSNAGLFGFTTNGEIKNVTVENAKVSGRLNVGVVAGTPYTSKYSNVTVKGHVEVNGMSYVGGVGGKNAYANWTDIKVEVDETSYVKATSTENGTAYRTYVGGVIGFMGEGGHSFKNIVSNIDVIGDVCDIGGITGIAHYNNKFENVTCSGNVTNTNTDAEDVKETGGIAGVWHNEKGTTVTFTNCKYTGKVTAANKDVTATNNITGAPYNASNDTIANSGKLVIDGIVVYPFIAKIGNVGYGSLQAAINEVKNGETITLVSDATVTEAAHGQNALNYAKAVNCTIDLGGYTLSADTGNSVFRFNIADSGATEDVTITLKNGKVVAGSNTWCAVMAKGIEEAKAVFNLEDLTIEASKAGDLAVKAWENAVVNAKNVTVNATNAAGGFYAIGGEIVLDNCTVNQEGLHTAPYLSMAVAVSDGGKLTVNSGEYSSEPTAAAEGNNQGSSHGSWVGGVMNSGGTLIINGGTFANGNFGDDSLATYARGAIMVDTAGKAEINGGTFNTLKAVIDIQNNLGDAEKNPVVTINGGKFSADPTVSASYGSDCIKVADDCKIVKIEDYYILQEKVYVAEVNDKKYESLQEAIDAATAENDTIILLTDITVESDLSNAAKGLYNIAEDDKITLDLNGKTINVTDKSTGNFIVFYNYGEFTIKNGTVNLTATNNRKWDAQSTIVLNRGGVLNVESGKYVHNGGTDMAITMDDSGNSFGDAEMYVKGGEITSTYTAIRMRMANTLLNGNPGNGTVFLEVTGGTISSANRGIWGQITNASTNELGTLNVTGGTVAGKTNAIRIGEDDSKNIDITISENAYINGVVSGDEEDFTISGGYFTQTPPNKYIVEGLVANLETNVKDGVTYLYVIGEKTQGEPELAVTPAAPEVSSKVDLETVSPEVKEEVEKTIETVTTGTTSFESTLPEASSIATEMNTNDHTEALKSLNNVLEDSQKVDNAEDITIHVRPYLDVQVEDVKLPEEGSAPEVKLDITMKYDVVASTEKDAEKIVTAEEKEEGETVNAVVTDSGKLTVEQGTEVEITVPLPEIFEPDDVIVVKHIKDDGTVYYYDAIVNDDDTITFINPNGFSTFIITRDNRTATVNFNTSDSTVEQASFAARNINTTSLPTLTKDGYIFKGWNFEDVAGGPYSGAMTEELLTKLSEAFTNNGSAPIVATPVFEEAPASSGGSSSNDSIAEEEKTEKPVQTDSVGKETVEDGKDELGTLIGDSYGLYKLALSVKLEGELDKATNIKIKVDGVTKADSVIILQKTADGWKAVPAEAGDGYVIGKFTSLSEVLIFVNENGEVEAAQEPELVEVAMVSKPASTGDSANILAYAGMISVAAAGLAVLFFRKRRA